MPGPGRPLEGLRVVDLSRVLAGPYATQLLGDLGAEVWKIERPGAGDETRAWGPPFVGGESAYFLSVNRNKRSAALDFQDPGHLAALRRAVAAADIVVENFLPGDLEPFALDARSLRAAHPELIVCSITGFGQDGPYAQLPGYDAVLQGFTGLMSVTGEPDGRPLKVGVAVVDILTGAHALAAILAALVGRLRGGGGATLDVALFEVGVVALANLAQAALSTGAPARRYGNAHAHIVPYQTFEAAGRSAGDCGRQRRAVAPAVRGARAARNWRATRPWRATRSATRAARTWWKRWRAGSRSARAPNGWSGCARRASRPDRCATSPR